MKRIISLITLGCMFLALCSCSSNKISFDDERLTNIRVSSTDGTVYTDKITLHCKNAVHSDNFNTIEITPQIEADSDNRLYIQYVFNENKFLAQSYGNNVVGILSADGAFEELFSDNTDRNMNILCCDDDYIIYMVSLRGGGRTTGQIHMYSLSEKSNLKIVDIDDASAWVNYSAVRVDDVIYYNSVNRIEDGYAVESIMEYNISKGTNQLFCADAALPSIYNGKLAFVKNNTSFVEYTDGGFSEILDLKESGLYRTVRGHHISGDKVCYDYSIYTDETYDGATGSGVGFIKDGKRYEIADSEAYMCSLSIEGNLAAWNYDCAEGVFPIVYDLETDTATVLDAERSVYWSFVSDNTVYFAEYPSDSEEIRIITYSKN